MNHEKGLAERSGAFSKDFVGVEGDNVAEREDEWVDVFHVEIVGRNGVGN